MIYPSFGRFKCENLDKYYNSLKLSQKNHVCFRKQPFWQVRTIFNSHNLVIECITITTNTRGTVKQHSSQPIKSTHLKNTVTSIPNIGKNIHIIRNLSFPMMVPLTQNWRCQSPNLKVRMSNKRLRKLMPPKECPSLRVKNRRKGMKSHPKH